MRERKRKIYAADFETLAEDIGQTWVWGGTIVEVHPGTYHESEVIYFHSIEEFFGVLEDLTVNQHAVVYFHNLKFDGAFILDFLLRSEWFQAVKDDTFYPDEHMPIHSYRYLISHMGQWYNIVLITSHGYKVTIRDSLKLFPMKLDQIGKGFKTQHQKTAMEYKGYREPGYIPTPEELQYMKNDVLVLAEALAYMAEQGHNKSTIGSCCLSEYKTTFMIEYGRKEWKRFFPDLTDFSIDPDLYGVETAEKYIRKAYRGGWCYLKKGCEDQIYHDGGTYDVNSLYPSMMHSDSGNVYPVGLPHFFRGSIPEGIEENTLKYYFVRIRCRFNIRPGFLPFIQMKHNSMYRVNEMLETSDIDYQGQKIRYYLKDGDLIEHKVELTLTKTDFDLFRKHYDADIEILDGCWFDATRGLFDFYIAKYRKIKQENTGALRQIAKLFLNNLYGQEAKSPNSSYKVARLADGVVKFHDVTEFNKKVVYIPIGAAITSYARAFTITAAQNNFDNFIYADTDSIHVLDPENIKRIRIDDSAFQCWALENTWHTGFFHRQKTYIEIGDNTVLKAAGMPEESKAEFLEGLESGRFTLQDFTAGLQLTGKLMPARVPGGVVLRETTYVMRD